MNRKPPELHLLDGTKSRRNNVVTLPEKIKARIPEADWMDNPEAWDKKKFVKETSDFLFEVYGIGNDQDKHALAMLANHIERYVECERIIKQKGLVAKFNGGKTVGQNPYLTISNKTVSLIFQMMNELGLTPRGRLAAGKFEDQSPMAQLLKGPLG